MKHAALTLAALVTLTTLTPSSTAHAQTASSTETTCEVCIPADYRSACDGYKRGLKTCRDDREQDELAAAAVRLALNTQKKLTLSETRRADRAEATFEKMPAPSTMIGAGLLVACAVSAIAVGLRAWSGQGVDPWGVGVSVVQCGVGGVLLAW